MSTRFNTFVMHQTIRSTQTVFVGREPSGALEGQITQLEPIFNTMFNTMFNTTETYIGVHSFRELLALEVYSCFYSLYSTFNVLSLVGIPIEFNSLLYEQRYMAAE